MKTEKQKNMNTCRLVCLKHDIETCRQRMAETSSPALFEHYRFHLELYTKDFEYEYARLREGGMSVLAINADLQAALEDKEPDV